MPWDSGLHIKCGYGIYLVHLGLYCVQSLSPLHPSDQCKRSGVLLMVKVILPHKSGRSTTYIKFGPSAASQRLQ